MAISTFLSSVPGVVMGSAIWLSAESPRWLVEKEPYEKTKVVLERLHGNCLNGDFIQLEFRETIDTIKAEKQVAVSSWKEMIPRACWRRRLTLGMCAQAFGQLFVITVMYDF